MKKMDETLYKRTIYKRVLAGVLAILIAMTSTNADWNAMRYVHADDVGPEITYSVIDENEHEIFEDGVSAGKAVHNLDDDGICEQCGYQYDFSDAGISPFALDPEYILYGQDNVEGHERKNLKAENDVHFDYGTKIELSLDGADGDITYNIKGADDDEDKVYEDKVYDPGVYFLGCDDEDGTVINVGSAEYKFTIDPAPLAPATGLSWDNGSVAKWNTVTKDRNGNDIKSGKDCSYSLELYQDGVKKDTIAVSKVSGDIQSYDLTDRIIALGGGRYTFKVVTKVASGSEDLYADSEASDEVTNAALAVAVTIKKENDGISTATVDGSSEESFVLISSNSSKNNKNITATAATSWTFDKWSVADSYAYAGKLSFEHASNAATKVTLADLPQDYNASKGYAVDITAESKEVNAPTIVASSYKAADGDNVGKLCATAYDNQSGIVAYAFSLKATEEAVEDGEWKTLATPAIKGSDEAATYYSDKIEESGTYYFYVKDEDGNIAKSSSGIKAAIITLDNYYVNNVKQTGDDAKVAILGETSYTFPSSSELGRKGYTFGGWYVNSDFSDSAVTNLPTNPATSKTYYAKWTLDNLAWTTALDGTTTEYTGEDQTYTVAVNATSADVTYEWYKKNTKTETFDKLAETSATLKLRDVKDSGTYRVDAKFTYVDDNGKTQTQTLSGTAVELKITPKRLDITAVDKTVTYGDIAPTYTFTYAGLVGDDKNEDGSLSTKGQESVTEGSLHGTYNQWDDVNETGYAISFSQAFASPNGNYSIYQNTGKLAVEAKDVASEGSGVVVSLTSNSYGYTGSAITPEFTVKDGDSVISADNYDISYGNGTKDSYTTPEDSTVNKIAGNHVLILTFKQNYKNTIVSDWEINKGTFSPTITIADWEYGDTASDPSIVAESIPADISSHTETYYYLNGEVTSVNKDSNGTTTKPVNAGTYTVYAIVHDEDGNYEDQVSAPYKFQIKPRKIIFTAKSQEWTYDGNAHSYEAHDDDHGYVMTDSQGNELANESDVFVLAREGFQSITLSGSVKDVNLDDEGNNIGQPNKVTVTLTSVTNKDNYEIVCIDGVLKVNPEPLNSPANIQWDSSDSTKAGTASWVAITKKDLKVKYEVKLYVHDDKNPATDTLVKTITTSDSTYDFTSDIHNQIGEGAEKSFYFTVKTLVDESTSEPVRHDYIESPESEHSGNIHTATFYLSKKRCKDDSNDEAGLETLTFTGGNEGKSSITLISGESLGVHAETLAGYDFESHVNCENEGDSHGFNTIWHPNDHAHTNFVSTSYSNWYRNDNKDYIEGTITLKTGMTKSLARVDITANVGDRGPQISNDLHAANADDLSGVNVSFTMSDVIGLKGWKLVEYEEYTYTAGDGKTYTSHREKDGGYSKEHTYESPLVNTSQTENIKIAHEGIFAISAIDTAGKMSHSEYITIYKIDFDKGDTTDNEHTMSTIYKLANTEITLPECTYTKTGYAFQNWKGATTGTSTDQAVYKANASDTLTAQWTNQQYKYTVNYYYMKTDGTYADEPSDTAEFYGKYGDVISAVDTTDEHGTSITATTAVLKPKTNYAIDSTASGKEGYKPYIKLTGNGQVLNIYYSSGTYTITYTYTLPNAGSPTTETQRYKLGAEIVELAKPDKTADGYDFVGWEYAGYGTKPETMPAKNISATGKFVPKNATYKVVYHLEDLGTGDTHEEKYTINESLTETLNSKQGTTITAYAGKKGSALSADDVEVDDIEGFTFKSMYISTGAPSGNTIPTENSYSTGNATGTVEYNAANTLYINYYMERNVYTFAVKVYATNRDSEENVKYLFTKKYQYDEQIENYDKYEDDSFWESEELPVANNGQKFAMPSGHKFTSYTDYSTGTKVANMPAGDVTVIRDIIVEDKVEYNLNIYFEKAQIGEYSLATTLKMTGNENANVHIVDSDQADTTEDIYVNINKYVQTIANHDYYTKVSKESLSEGDPNKEKIVEEIRLEKGKDNSLNVYFERRTSKATITYYYGNETSKKNIEFAKCTVTGKWGTKYIVDPKALFDTDSNDTDWKGVGTTVSSTSIDPAGINIEGTESSGKAYDFRHNDYLISYINYYKYFDSNDILQGTYPSYTFESLGDGTTKSASGNIDRGIDDKIECTFGVPKDTPSYMSIYYNEIKESNEFYIDFVIDTQTRIQNRNSGRDENGDLEKYAEKIPIEYKYNDAYYPLRAMNACAILNSTENSGTPVDNYPAAELSKKTYTHTNPDDVKTGFTRIEQTNYYFYDGTGSLTDSTPCVYIAVADDRFVEGARVSYSHYISGEQDWQAVQDFLTNYKTTHSDAGDSDLYDANADVLAVYNTSWGPGYCYGPKATLSYNYYYKDKYQLTYYMSGKTCQNAAHAYVAGTTVTKADIHCEHIAPQVDGYETVWYTDAKFTIPIPESGIKMDGPRYVYGRSEKSTITNKEYIYYELADPVSIGDAEVSYVTPDNLSSVRAKLGDRLTESTNTETVNLGTEEQPINKVANIKTYYVDGVVVLVERDRPTFSFGELYLSKDAANKTYEEAYGMEGFHYDQTNIYNRSYGYVNATPISLKVYFERDRYEVEIDPQNSATSNKEYKEFSIGHSVELGTYTKDGYTFDSWKWEIYNAKQGTYVDYNPEYVEGQSYFKMPAANLKATAQWTAGNFDADIIHYFQGSDQAYHATFIDEVEGGGSTYTKSGTINKAIFADTEYDAEVYEADGQVKAVTLTKGGMKYYFSAATSIEGETTKVKVTDANLVAATGKLSVKSEETTAANKEAISDLAMYSHSYTAIKSHNQVEKKNPDETYEAEYGMTLEYYYARSANCKVRLIGVSTDGNSNNGLTINGAGDKIFGEEVTVTSSLASGYEFKGWFKPEDVFSDYDSTSDSFDENKDLSSYTLKENLSEVVAAASPDYAGMTFSYTATEPLDLVAVVAPESAEEPDFELRGKTEYTYGYAASASNVLMAIAHKKTYTAEDNPRLTPEEIAKKNAIAAKTTITGYQWYTVEAEFDAEGKAVAKEGAEPVAIESQTSSSLLISTGKNAGPYVYRCDVYYKNSDNGRTGVLTKDIGVVVKKADMAVTITDYEGVFDNADHTITMSVDKADSHEIYYHADTALTKETYSSGSRTLPEYKDVKKYEVVEKNGVKTIEVTPNVTHIYIKDTSGNYNDYIGTGNVLIKPKSVSIQAKQKVFDKMYDGNTDVVGSLTDQSSDMGRFAKGNGEYYDIKGLVEGDPNSTSLMLDCKASFNSPHVTGAKSFNVSDMKIAFGDGSTDYNYSFPATATLTFSGHISPRPIAIDWEDNDRFTYNGQPQAPGVEFHSEQEYAIPECDEAYLTLTVSGKQTNVTPDDHNYVAYAAVKLAAGAIANPNDYTFDHLSKEYRITKRAITIKPVTTEVTYNGTAQTVTTWKIYEGDTETEDTVVGSYNVSATPVVSHVNVNRDTDKNVITYTDMQFKDIKITDGTGKELQGNYDVTYAYGELKINPCPVTVTGIGAKEKAYDGTNTVELTKENSDGASTLVFTPLYTQNGVTDKLDIDLSKITAHYDNHVANTTAVSLSIPADALTGDSVDNYVLDTTNSQDSATGRITQNTIKVKAEPLSVVYGEEATFDCTYSGIYKNDGAVGAWEDVSGVTGSVNYKIKTGRTGTEADWEAYTPGTIGVGTYEIKVDTGSISHADYTFAWEQDSAYSILTVTARPVVIKSATTPNVNKTYDGSVSVDKTTVTKTEDYIFDGLSGETATGVLLKDASEFDINRSNFEVTYNDADVKDANKVSLTKLTPNNENYKFVKEDGSDIASTDALDINATISKADLTLTLTHKSIVYGTATPTGVTTDTLAEGDTTNFHIGYTGFENNEGVSALHGTITVEPAYDSTDSGKRGVGKYAVKVKASGFDGDNYNIKLNGADLNSTGTDVANALTVTKAKITISIADKSMKYKVGPLAEIGWSQWTTEGYKYEEDTVALINAAVAGGSSIAGYITKKGQSDEVTLALNTLIGEYDIKLKYVPVSIDNYDIVVTTGKLEVIASNLYISNGELSNSITIAPKVYDGTTSIAETSITHTAANRTALIADLALSTKADEDSMLNTDKSYLESNTATPILKFDNSSAVYASKDVGTDIAVTVNYTLADYLKDRYVLKSDTDKTARADITARPVTITAVNKTVKYGEAVPTYTYTTNTGTGVGLVAGEKIASVTYGCTYTNDQGSCSDVGTYPITPSAAVAGENMSVDNYAITYANGTLTVNKNKLNTPAPAWKTDAPGTVEWAAIPSIGDVDVAGYVVELYKDGGASPVATQGSVGTPLNATSVDFASAIRANGGGQYTVKVTAIASKTNNDENKNVDDSEAGTTAKSLYATAITPVMVDKDGNKQSGKGEKVADRDPVYINNVASYVVIAGESDIPLKATLKNSTGYTVTQTASSGLTLGTGTIDSGTSIYATTVGIAANATPAATTEVKFTLNARPATVKATLSPTARDVNYGFVASGAPVITATPNVVSDNITTEDYTYSYEWQLKLSSSNDYVKQSEGDANTYKFPNMVNGNNTPYGTNYRVKCKVTATRKDNGESKTYESDDIDNSSYKFIRIRVNKGTLTPAVSYAAGKNTWVYGQSRQLPDVSGIDSEINPTTDITYQFSKDGTNWQNTMFTDVGTYKVRAHIKETANFDEAYTEPVEYTISQATLADPTNVEHGQSDTAPYGKLTWDSVAGPSENAGVTPASNISVKYAVTLSRADSLGGSLTPISLGESGTTAYTTAASFDFTPYIVSKGVYHMTVQAVVDEKRSGQDALNCANSSSVEKDAVITIGADVESNNADKNSFTKKYDGKPMTLTVKYSDGTGNALSYNWLKNGVAYDGAGHNTDTISITYVEENASFVCEVTSGGNKVYSKAISAKIEPRPITVTSADDTKVYDGTALTNTSSPAITYTGDASLTGLGQDGSGNVDTFTVNITGTATTVADTATGNNTFDTLVIKHGDKVVYSAGNTNNNYAVTPVYGTLSITKRPITVTANTAERAYNGSPLTNAGFTYTPNGTDEGIVSGHTVTATVTGTITNAGEEDNVISNIAIKDSGVDVTANYDITPVNGKLKITSAAASISISNSDKMGKTYDNTSVVAPVLNTEATPPTDKATYTKTGDGTVTLTYYDSAKNPIGTTAPKNAGTYYVKASTSATQNYQAAESALAQFVIAPRPITLKAINNNSVYGAAIKTVTYEARLTSGEGSAFVNDADKNSLGITVTTTATATSAVGLYPIQIAYTANGNYAVTLEHNTSTPASEGTYGTYKITNATMTVAAPAVEVVYDGQAHGLVVTPTTNAVAGDTATVYYATTALDGTNYDSVGQTSSPTFTDVKLTGDSVDSYTVYYYVVCDNYTPVAGSSTVTITKRPVTFTADSGIWKYDGLAHSWDDTTTNPTTHYSVTATEAGKGIATTDKIDSVSLSATITNVGSEDNTISTAKIVDKNNTTLDKTSNYIITYVKGKLEITKKPLTDTDITVAAIAPVTYRGTAWTPEPVVSDASSGSSVNLVKDSDFVYGYTNNIHAGTATVTITAKEGSNYSGTISRTFTINKRDIQIKSEDKTWTYDGDTHVHHEFVTDSGISKSGSDYIVTATGDKLTATFTGQIRDVQYSNGAVTTVDNTYNNVKFTNSDSAVGDTTGDYNITIQSGKLKVDPYNISAGILKLNDSTTFPVEVAYHNGHLAGPSYGVTAQIKSGTDTVLVETRDFVITDDAANNKQKQAIYPDTYTIEVTGKGNYTGKLTGTYTIKDSAKPEISGGTEKKHISLTDATHNVFCKEEPEIRIADQTLANVTITAKDIAANSTSTYANDSYNPKTAPKVDGKVVATYELPGSVTGIEYTIVATDMSGTVSDTVTVTVYSDHDFTTYTYDTDHQEQTAPCNHNCGETDTRVLTHVTVKWDYNFVYDVVGDENPHTGVQEHLARATFAKVELLQNDVPIATQIVDCNSTCSVSDEQSTGEASITFEKYKPGNATATVEEADTLIPKYDDNGEEYDYIVRVTPMKKIGDSLSSADADYHVKKTEGQTGVLPGHYEGVIALIQYGPNLFDVNWRVELTGLPTVNGHTVVPDALYVKVLYAYGPNADDSETISGYQIVSQQAGDSGTYCHVNHVDGKAVYTGKFPVWQRIPGTNDSYYHRIQVVGYRYHNVDYDVKSQNLKSINDSDHVNHTIYHVGNGVASGVIKYELGNLQLATPVVMLDHNPGNDTTNVITGSPNYYVVTSGGDVTAEQLTAAEPLRNSTYYDFLGWFDAKTGGSKVTELTSVTEDKRLYAHWKEKVAPNATIHAGDVSWSDVTDVSDPDDPDSKHVIKTNVITVDAYDNGLLGGIQTGVNNSGVSKVYYYKSTTEVNDFETTIADGDWVSAPLSGSGEHVTASINLGANGYYLIYLKIVDEDGNVTYLNSDGITVDKPAPVPQTPSGDKPSGDTPSGGLPQVKPTEAPAPTLPAKPELPTPGKQPVQPVQPVQPMITPIPETPGKTETPEQGKEEDDKAGKLVVKAERVEREETKPTEHLHTAELPDKDAVANAVLTEEEWKILDDGGEITIRLLIDDAKQVEDEKALEKTLEGLLDQMKLPEEEKKDKKVVFKSYVDLRLEKKVNDSDWERLLSSGEEIQVVINIPENLKQEGVPLYLAKADGSGYILIEDLDDNPDTITFMTDDFDSDYMIVSIGENKVPLADLFLPENNDCFWHWIILLMLILSAVTAIIWWKKEDEEEEDEAAAATVENEEDDDRRKVRRKGHYILLILFNGVGAICVYFGSCRLDLPFEIVSILLSAIIELAKGYKNRDVRRDENRD